MNALEKKLDYKLARFSCEAIPVVEALHAAVYGSKPETGLYAKKYDTAFAGASYVGFIAYGIYGKAIAFYGALPCFIAFNYETILAAASAYAMTHPDYRRQGLFEELASRTVELCRTLGVKLVFGFPNQNSLPGFLNKLG